MRLFLLASLAALALLASSPASAITNGEPDGNAHPWVGLMYAGRSPQTLSPLCSGTLIAPRVFLTAGHCLPAFIPDGYPVAVTFTSAAPRPPVDPSSPSFVWGTWHRMTGFCEACAPGLPGFSTNDLAIVKLSANGPAGPYPQLPTLGFVDTLPNRTPVELVGYGTQGFGPGGPAAPINLLERYRATSALVANRSVFSDSFLRLQANKGGSCFGDSGGPNLVGNTIVGVNSFVTNAVCAGVTYSTRLDTPQALHFIGRFL